MSVLLVLIQIVALLLLAPLYDGIARVLRGKLQLRVGPPDVFQTYRDIIKLLKRGRVVSRYSHFVFRYGPYMLLGIGISLVAAVPIVYNSSSLMSYYSDIFIVIYLIAMMRFIFGVISIDSANPYAGIGGSREQTMALYVEPSTIISLLVVMLLAGTSNIPAIKEMIQAGIIGYHIPSFAIASIVFLWVMYVESGRIPYDLAEAEQEIQEGVLGEYSSFDFAIASIGLKLKQVSMIGMFLIIFEPWNFANPILALIVTLIEIGVLYVSFVFIDNFLPRFKILSSMKKNAFGVLSIGFISLILYIFGV
ncbi:MAG: respiratory chain complex I subunit 1 family protein [Campylobacteraceae bacterium]